MSPKFSWKSAILQFAIVFAAVFGALWANGRLVAGQQQVADQQPAPSSGFDFTAAAQKAITSVVSIDAALRNPDFFGDSQLRTVGSGSGVVVQADGYIVTNAHVVRNPLQRGRPIGADVVKVRTNDGKGYDAKVIGIDPTSDLAVIKVEGASLVPASLGDSESIQIGDWVVAVGNQLGFDNSVSVGVVSSKNRWLDTVDSVLIDAIQTDATINRGNSGGALCNLSGEVIGINSSIATENGVYSGVGFAIPIKLVSRVVQEIIDHGFVKYASLGVELFRPSFSLSVPQDRENLMAWSESSVEPPDYGVVIGEVAPDSPAAKARIRQFDVLLEIEGRRMYSTVDFVRSTMEKRPGDEVEIKVWSKGQTKTIRVVLDSQSP